eukprot:541891-Prymnesium_polylepis.2
MYADLDAEGSIFLPPCIRHIMRGLDSNLDITAVYAVARHRLKTTLKATLDFGADSPRPREFQSS